MFHHFVTYFWDYFGYSCTVYYIIHMDEGTLLLSKSRRVVVVFRRSQHCLPSVVRGLFVDLVPQDQRGHRLLAVHVQHKLPGCRTLLINNNKKNKSKLCLKRSVTIRGNPCHFTTSPMPERRDKERFRVGQSVVPPSEIGLPSDVQEVSYSINQS